MAVTRGTLAIARNLRRDIGTEADAAVRTLATEWVDAWDGLTAVWQVAAEQLTATAMRLGRWPRPDELLRMESVDRAMRASVTALGKLAERTETVTTDAADRAIRLDAEREARIIASQAPDVEEPGLARMLADRLGVQQVEAMREAWTLREQARDDVRLTVVSRIRTDAINVIARRTGEQIHSDVLPLSDEAADTMRRELVRGIDVGDNPRTTAARIVAMAQGGFNGGLTRALNIARTEMLDAYRATSRQIHMANADIVPGWQWLSTLDRRVCPSCLSLHGTQHPVSEPGPQDHQSGRCARLPVLATWSELGITAPEPPSAMRSAEAWFAGLPRTAQLQIMGPARLQLLDDGRIGWGDLSTTRQSPRWRPSRVPTPVRDLRRRADRGLPPTPRPAPARLVTTTLPVPRPRITPTQQVEGGDFAGLRQVGPQRGSNPGGLFEAADGSRWYLKAMPEDRARNEALAAALYREAGVRAPTVVVGRGAPGLSGEVQVASRLVDDAAAVRGADEVRDQLREGFGADAWLANWDVTGATWDNVVFSGGNVWRIDAGGSLRFRAQGGPKGTAFGPTVNEWLTLRDPFKAPVASQAFRGMTPAELLAAAKRVQAVKPTTIRRLVAEHGLDKDLANVLVARRKDVVERIAALREQVKRHAAYERARGRALAGQDAVDAAPRHLNQDGTAIVGHPSSWTSDRAEAATRAAAYYRGTGYNQMNGRLRGSPGSPETWLSGWFRLGWDDI